MAATDVLPSSPMSPGLVTPWSGFEDYLDFPSPANTPRLAPATSTVTTNSYTSLSSSSLKPPPLPLAVTSSTSSSTSSRSPSTAALPESNQTGPPPSPGSSPETLFRYYLAAELRRIGSPADDAIIERYVAQHYDSFTRAMERHQTSQAAMSDAVKEVPQPMNGVQAFRSPPPSGPSSAPLLLNNAAPQALQSAHVPTSIDPHMVEGYGTQHFDTSAMTSTSVQPVKVKSEMDIIVTHPSPSTESPSAASLSYRSKSADDDMSEDEEDELDGDIKGSGKGKLRTIEETPIEGSIMGPSNELRPDPDTYRKLTSKEKRQLRNKISARNFRTRRKEHISLLEQQVADRDTLIEGLRQQLAQVTVQNKDLQEEVRALKAKAISTTDVTRIIDALQRSANVSGTGSSNTDVTAHSTSILSRSASNSSLSDPLNAVRPPTPSVAPSSSPRSMSPRPSISIAKPNTRKDVPGTSGGASGARSFWGGVGGASGSNFMSVHTVLIPSYHEAQAAAEKRAVAAAAVNSLSDVDTDVLANLTEKLSLTVSPEKREHTLSPALNATSTGHKKDSDVNAALVSLIDGDNCPPPSYSEAVDPARQNVSSAAPAGNPSLHGPENDRVHESILSALNKAFSSTSAMTQFSVDHKRDTPSTSSPPSLDARRVQALLDGRAELLLVDANGQPWRDEERDIDQASCISRGYLPDTAIRSTL